MTLARPRLLLLALPLALGLAACGGKEDAATGSAGGTVAEGEPVAKVAAPAGKAWSDVIAATPEGGYLMGNPDAPIKVIEFGALSCSHCAEFSEKGFPALRDNYINSGRVSFELRLFMLNALDLPSALLATCGSPEAVIPLSEQFWAWQPTMFANLQANEAQMRAVEALPPEQRFAGIAKVTGMDQFFAARGIATDQGAQCLANSAKATGFVEATNAAAKQYNVNGTPTFIINGKNAEVASWAELEPLLQKAGAR